MGYEATGAGTLYVTDINAFTAAVVAACESQHPENLIRHDESDVQLLLALEPFGYTGADVIYPLRGHSEWMVDVAFANKYQDDENRSLMLAVAPYCVTGEIRFVGEDGTTWKFLFDHGGVIEYEQVGWKEVWSFHPTPPDSLGLRSLDTSTSD